MSVPQSRREFLTMATGLGAGATLIFLTSACTPPSGSSVSISVEDVPVGGGVVKDGFVITQPTAGEFHAFESRCPHAGAKVSRVENGTVVCDHHGARFSGTDGASSGATTSKALTPAVLKRTNETLTIRKEN